MPQLPIARIVLAPMEVVPKAVRSCLYPMFKAWVLFVVLFGGVFSAQAQKITGTDISATTISTNDVFTVSVDGKNDLSSLASQGGISIQIREALYENDKISVYQVTASGSVSPPYIVWRGGSLSNGAYQAQYLQVEPTWSNWESNGYRTSIVRFKALKPGSYSIYAKMYLLNATGAHVYPTTSSYTDHQGEKTIFVGTVTVTDPKPNPNLRPVSITPSTVQLGQPITISISADNQGDEAGNYSSLTASAYWLGDETRDISVSSLTASWADQKFYRNRGDSPIYDKNDSPITAVHKLVEFMEANWPAGQRLTATFVITPDRVGTLRLRVRATMNDKSGSKYNDYSDSGRSRTATDQQGWEVAEYDISVTAPTASVNARLSKGQGSAEPTNVQWEIGNQTGTGTSATITNVPMNQVVQVVASQQTNESASVNPWQAREWWVDQGVTYTTTNVSQDYPRNLPFGASYTLSSSGPVTAGTVVTPTVMVYNDSSVTRSGTVQFVLSSTKSLGAAEYGSSGAPKTAAFSVGARAYATVYLPPFTTIAGSYYTAMKVTTNNLSDGNVVTDTWGWSPSPMLEVTSSLATVSASLEGIAGGASPENVHWDIGGVGANDNPVTISNVPTGTQKVWATHTTTDSTNPWEAAERWIDQNITLSVGLNEPPTFMRNLPYATTGVIIGSGAFETTLGSTIQPQVPVINPTGSQKTVTVEVRFSRTKNFGSPEYAQTINGAVSPGQTATLNLPTFTPSATGSYYSCYKVTTSGLTNGAAVTDTGSWSQNPTLTVSTAATAVTATLTKGNGYAEPRQVEWSIGGKTGTGNPATISDVPLNQAQRVVATHLTAEGAVLNPWQIRERWVDRSDTYTSSSNAAPTYARNLPYAKEISMSPSGSVAPGATVTPRVLIQNDSGSARSGKVQLVLSSGKTLSGAEYGGGGAIKEVTFSAPANDSVAVSLPSFTAAEGSYYSALKVTTNGFADGSAVTDTWGWSSGPAITATSGGALKFAYQIETLRFSKGSAITIPVIVTHADGTPVANTAVGLEDGVLLQSRSVGMTDNYGRIEISYSVFQTADLAPGAYQITALVGGEKSTLIFSIIDQDGAYANWENSIMSFGANDTDAISGTATSAFLPLGPNSSISLPSNDEMLNVGREVQDFLVDWGKSAGRDFWDNPLNKGAVIAGIVACPLTFTPAAPVAGPVCGKSVSIIATGAVHSLVVTGTRTIIDELPIDPELRTQLNIIVSGLDVVYSVATIKPGKGIDTVWKALDATYVVSKFSQELMYSEDGEVVGFKLVVVDEATGETRIIVARNREDPFGIEQYEHEGWNLLSQIPLENRNNLVDLSAMANGHLRGDDGEILGPTDQKLIIFFHGWNDSASRWAIPFTNALLSHSRLSSGWKTVSYDWSNDANTGPLPIVDSADAAERAYQHGLMVAGKLLSQVGAQNLKEVQFVGHSAGAWAALAAACGVNLNTSATEVQVTFLDPYIPNNELVISNHPFIAGYLQGAPENAARVNAPGAAKAEAYWSDDPIYLYQYYAGDSSPYGTGDYTKVTWTWTTAQQSVVLQTDATAYGQEHWDGHDGPLWYYLDSIIDPTDSKLGAGGWKNSLAYRDAQAITTYSVSGRVTSSQFPYGGVPGVSVSTGAGAIATTDYDGRYTIYGLDPGSYTITANHPDYYATGTSASASRSVTITSNSVSGADFTQFQGKGAPQVSIQLSNEDPRPGDTVNVTVRVTNTGTSVSNVLTYLDLSFDDEYLEVGVPQGTGWTEGPVVYPNAQTPKIYDITGQQITPAEVLVSATRAGSFANGSSYAFTVPVTVKSTALVGQPLTFKYRATIGDRRDPVSTGSGTRDQQGYNVKTWSVLIDPPPTAGISLSGNMDFGNVLVGAMTQRTLRISNSGTASLNVSGITAPAGYTASWSGTIAADNGHQDVTVTFAPSAQQSYAGTINVVSDASAGDSSIAVSGFGVGPFISVSPLQSTVPAWGDSVTISVASNTSWSVASNQTWATVAPGSGSGNGSVVVTVAENDTSSSRQAQITIGGQTHVLTQNPPAETAPSFAIQPQNRSIAETGGASFAVLTAGNPAPTLQWQVSEDGGSSWSNLSNSGTYSGTATATLTIVNATVGMDGNRYRVLASNTAGSATSVSASLTVTATPTRVIELGGSLSFGEVAVGESAVRTLTIHNAGNATLTVSDITYPAGFTSNWTSGIITAGGFWGVPVIFLPTAEQSYGGTITVSSDKTDGANVIPVSGTGIAAGSPPAFTTQPQSQSVTSGSDATLSVAVIGDPVPTLQWQLSTNGGSDWADVANSGTYAGANTSVLTISGVGEGMNGNQYRVLASNSAQSDVTSVAATLTVVAGDDDLWQPSLSELANVGVTLGTESYSGNETWLFDGAAYATGPADTTVFADSLLHHTVVGWFKTTALEGTLVSASDSSFYDDYYPVAVIISGGYLSVGGRYSSSSGHVGWGSTFASASRVDDDDWHHFAVILDQSNAQAKVYLDGVEIGFFGISSTANYRDGGTVRFGASRWNGRFPHEPFTGYMAGMAVYARGLSEYEIANLGLRLNTPSAPVEISASDGVYPGKVMLTWTAVDGATGYDVYRGNGNDSSSAVKLNSGPVVGTTYDDETVESGTVFWYWVKAINDSGSSDFGSPDAGSSVASNANNSSWVVQNPGSSISFTAVAWGADRYVAVGSGGVVQTSVDGTEWNAQSTGSSQALYGVAWNGDRYIAVGGAGTILVSQDGESWTNQTSGVTHTISDVIWNSTQFVAVGASGRVLTSPDGLVWTVQSSGTNQSLNSVASSGSRMVAVGFNGTIVTSDDGVSWVVQNSGTTDWLNDVAWNGSRFVAVGHAGAIFTSLDGVSWVKQSAVTDLILNDVAWMGGKFVAAGEQGIILTSADGLVWAEVGSAVPGSINGLAWSGSEYVAVGSYGAILLSDDGIQWNLRATPKLSLWRVIWDGLQYVAVGNNGMIQTSRDGEVWGVQNSGVSKWLRGLAWSGSRYVAVGASGTIITSTNATVWTSIESGTLQSFVSVTWGNGQFVAVGSSGVILTSEDGMAWTTRTSGTTTSLNDVAWNGSRYVAVGASGTILTSADGDTWISQSGINQSLGAVTWGDGKFVSVGQNGTILTSDDGITWTSQVSGSTENLWSVIWSGDRYVALGNSGTILVSVDGVTWGSAVSGTVRPLYGVGFGAGQFVAVGADGVIILDGTSMGLRPAITEMPVRRHVISPHQSFALSVTVTGADSYVWVHNGSRIIGAASPSLAFENVGREDGGWYQLTLENSHGITKSPPIFVMVVPTKTEVVGWGDGVAVPDGMTDIIAIAANAQSYHTIGLKADGSVVGWQPAGVPVGLSDVVSIAAGGAHQLALKADGTVVAWGDNSQGQTNVPTGLSNVVAIAAGMRHSVALTAEGTVVEWGKFHAGYDGYITLPVPIGLEGVVQVSAGDHTLAIMADGRAVEWGSSWARPTSLPADAVDLAMGAVGAYHSVGIKTDGSLVAWGINGYGATQMPVDLSDVIEVAAGQYFNVALKSNGALAAWGWDHIGQASPPDHLTGVVGIAAGGTYAYALRDATQDQDPQIIGQPQAQTVTYGGAVNFTVTLIGNPFPTLQWQESTDGGNSWSSLSDDGAYAGTTTTTLTITGVIAGMNGYQYRALASNAAQSNVTSNAAALAVSKLSQAITFGALSNQTFGSSPLDLNATATSGLSVSFSVVSGPAELSGASLTLTGTGTVTVRASQAGDETYEAAPSVERSFTVSAAPAIDSLDDPDHDGLSNLLEYALGLDPAVANSAGLPEVSATATEWVYTFKKPESVTDVIYEVEVSSNLSTWSAEGVALEKISTSDGVETWRAAIPLSSMANAFFRLKITGEVGSVSTRDTLQSHSTLGEGLVQYFKFDGSGTDEVGANSLTLQGVTFDQTSPFGYAAVFDGNGNYAAGKTIDPDPYNSGYSVSGWIYLAPEDFSAPDDHIFFFLAEDGYWGQVRLTWHPGSPNDPITYRFGAGTPSANYGQAYPRPASGWRHVVITHGLVYNRLYVDGVLVHSSASLTLVNNSDTLLFGAAGTKNLGSLGNFLRGKISNFGIWTRELTEQEVQALYNDGEGLPFR